MDSLTQDQITHEIEESLRTPADPTIDAYCDECGEEILSSDTGYKVDHETNLCQGCFENHLEGMQIAWAVAATESFNHDYREG